MNEDEKTELLIRLDDKMDEVQRIQASDHIRIETLTKSLEDMHRLKVFVAGVVFAFSAMSAFFTWLWMRLMDYFKLRAGTHG
jgi:hypothetical protein